MKVLVVAEFYPRVDDPVFGIWGHRQALAARDAGADLQVVVLHRVVPPAATPKARMPSAALALWRHPRVREVDGLTVHYVPFVSPPRSRTYGSWGAWAAPALKRALPRIRREFPYELLHAHNAVPAGDAARRADPRTPLVVSVHGGDVYYTGVRSASGERNVRAAFEHARTVLANSVGTAERAVRLGAPPDRTRVVRLGADVPPTSPRQYDHPTLVTVAHLVGRKRHQDVIRALWLLRDRHPDLRYLVVGDGPERSRLEQLAVDIGVADRVEFAGQRPHREAVTLAHGADLFVMPSVDEAFGVAYVEAMAGGVPAIASLGEPGPAEIAQVGDGMALVPPGDVEALAAEIDALLADRGDLGRLGSRARATVERSFTWARCGEATVAAYDEVLGRR
ncbi:glycosyltransferase [Paraconexibacter sp.]|uniref:glycosyltransferase n=1 Tax=Paraconexibacter sp. TaxID=2949640 RepID=UPI0035624198